MTINSTSSEMTMEDGIPLQSSKSTLRLEQIASLRANGIADHIDLPQLVVCGDQSAGKSSVLEGLTGIPFPRQDGVCTKFATEIILQHTDDERKIVATIIPHHSRSGPSKDKLRQYKREFQSFAELPVAIEDAGSLMGIKGFKGLVQGPSFAEDVLRIEVLGKTGLHLSVVDLPGLIGVPSEEQTDNDVDIVHNLADSYVRNPRTIILAVVQAGNDIANQTIIKKSKSYDIDGKRTVGIITKPDLINEKTEKRIALLSKNQDTTKLKLGFFLVKNPKPTELAAGITLEQRQKNEKSYFQESPWKGQALDMDRVGIVSLRTYIQSLLDQHIEQELPKVREEIRDLMGKTEREIRSLGDERQTISEIRIFLTNLSMQFRGLVTTALNGPYDEMDSDFFLNSDSARLRAKVHRLNTDFSAFMRDDGAMRKIVDNADAGSKVEKTGQILVTEEEMKEWVKKIYLSTRGKELPGNYTLGLLSELFHIQSSRWHRIAQVHLIAVYHEVMKFINAALRQITRDQPIHIELQETTTTSIQELKESAEKELEKIWKDERIQPITYNHYYTDNVQKARNECTGKAMESSLESIVRSRLVKSPLNLYYPNSDRECLLSNLRQSVEVGMDDQAYTEALIGLKAYYKVAMKTFVDNVCRQVIERHLLRNLPGVFCPERVASMSDETLKAIGSETQDNKERRKQLRELHDALALALQNLRRQSS